MIVALAFLLADLSLSEVFEIVKVLGVPGTLFVGAGVWVTRYLVPSMQADARQLREECREDAKASRGEFLAALDKRDALLERIEARREASELRTDQRLDKIERFMRDMEDTSRP